MKAPATIVSPGHPALRYEGFVRLHVGEQGAWGERPVTDSRYTLDCPGATIRFRTDAAAGEILVTYRPKRDFPDRDHFRSDGVVLRDGNRVGTFTRARDEGGPVSVAFSAASPESAAMPPRLQEGACAVHEYTVLLPFADVVIFRGLRLPPGSELLPSKPSGGQRYVALGDSITQGFCASDTTRSYAWRVAETMGWRLTDLGFGGRVATPSDAGLVTKQKPDVVSILFGINDCLQGLPVTVFGSRYAELLDGIRRECPGALIAMITPLAVPGKWAGTEVLEDYRRALRALTTERSDPRLHLVEGETLIPSQLAFFEDGLHPNDAGFETMAGNLVRELRRVVSEETIRAKD